MLAFLSNQKHIQKKDSTKRYRIGQRAKGIALEKLTLHSNPKRYALCPMRYAISGGKQSPS
jgi:hypothetical protein